MKRLLLVASVLVLLGAAVAVVFARFYRISNVNPAADGASIRIASGSSFEDVLQELKRQNILISATTFEKASEWKGYTKKVRGGNYVFKKGISNRALINTLKGGLQTPVKLVMYNLRTREEFAGLVGRTLEMDSNRLLATLSDTAFCNSLHTDTHNVVSHFLMDNYEFYWNVSEETFLKKMKEAYEAFWNVQRRSAAEKLGMSPDQVSTLASIVEREVIFDKEMPTVAGVYLNRLRIGMPLQADPTLVFATRDFDTRRVTNYHKEFDSPYNTYKYAGLPPGPICMPKKRAIEAVLKAEQHKYLYFCADPDMSGYSIFSETYAEQLKVAARYQQKLNAMRIR